MTQMTLRAARINAGLTQAEAAKKIGVSVDAVSKWERGLSVPNVRFIHMIETAYGVRYDDIKFFCA